ncbi:MAG: serine/threonine-protein kinase [Planctomycetota bacterium]|nr:serine/threonine-protein kinase [Planctomycetota bacterium]
MSDKVACTQCGKDHELIDLLRGLCPVCLFAQAVPDAARRSDSREARFVPPKILELAPHFPQLKILELIGQGGMSAVYKARQMSLDRTVAVKLLPQEVADSHGGLERFRQEAKTLAQLSHPNIVNVYDAGQAGPWCFIVMEFINGPNLRQLLGDSNLPTSDVLRYASEICDGLQYAHDRGVVHRDVKPENVLIADDGHVRLVDFGLAKLLKPSGSATTQTGRVIGTPHYLAPEQVETPGKVDHRADVYSLGVLIYEMLTGELPLGHFAPPSRRIGSDPAFDAVVLRAMARDAQQRYQCVRDVRAGIAAATAGGNSVLASKYRATWQTTASELFLSIGSIFAGLVGCCVLLVAFVVTDQNAPRKRSEPRVLGHFESRDPGKPVVTRVQEGDFVYDTTAPPEFLPAPGGELRSATGGNVLEIFPIAIWFTFAFVACLSSFGLARVNVSSKTNWRELSLAQIPSVPSLLAAYLLLGSVLLLGPGLAILLLGYLPLFAQVQHWSFLGMDFTAADRVASLTPYWLRVYSAGMITSAAWSLCLQFIVRARSSLLQRLFHPSSDDTTSAMTRTAAIVSACVLIPVGCVLLYASWAATPGEALHRPTIVE